MVDLHSMTDEQLRNHSKKNRKNKWTAVALLIGGTAGACLFGLAGGAATAFIYCAVIASGSFYGLACEQTERRCRQESDSRSPSLAAAPVSPHAGLPFSGPAQDFNPAAATVLESDMKSMSPLRLKKKAAEFLHG